MTVYLPEGALIHSPENQNAVSSIDRLAEAMQRHTILEGVAARCDSARNLHIQLGKLTGVIPRSEAALGLEEGKVKEISVLSRVGKPVAFQVIGLEANDGRLTPILSRKAAQLAARRHITALEPGAVIPAKVSRLERFGAFVDVGCGLISMIPIDRVSISRIPHPSSRFRVGQDILAVYLGVEPETGHILLSHRELLGTWEENAARFSPGETVTGIVRGIQPYGVFVELTPNLTGLAEFYPGLRENQRVSVYIKAIQGEKRKIKLSIIDAIDEVVAYEPAPYLHHEGSFADWTYTDPQ